jgi:high affinity sulfate transporter 1
MAPVAWLRDYRRDWLAKDIVGGIAAGAVVIPQAMAYATIADLPVQVGLYTCMVPMVVYALIGGSRTLSVSTTSTVALLTGSTLVAAGVAGNGTDPAGDLAALTLLVGVILVVARVLHLGSLVDNINEATLTGIKVGVGLTVAAGQLPKLLGIPGDPTADNFFSEMRAVVDHMGDTSVVTLVFSIGTLLVLYVVARFAPRVPAPLIAVVGGIMLVAVASLDQHGLAIVGHVPSGLPTPVAPAFDHIGDLLAGAFAIAIMVFLETVAVARNMHRPGEPPIENDQELFASGLSCAAGAFFGAMPSAGGFSQTAINQRAGARTQLSELVTVALAVASALVLGGILADLPEATLGCMVIVAVIGLIKPAEIVRFYRLSRIEFWVFAITAGFGLCFGLLVGVLVGVVLTLYLVLHELNRVGLTELQPTTDDADVEVAGANTSPVPGLLVLRFDGPLYTANIRPVNDKLVRAVDATNGTNVLLLDMSAVAALTLTVMDEMTTLEHALDERGITVWIAALPPRALATAKLTVRWDELRRNGQLFPTTLGAIHAYRGR